MKNFSIKTNNLYVVFALAIGLLAFVAISHSANAESPKLQVKQVIEDLKTIVKENTGKISEEEIDKKLEAKVKPMFDFDEMARRSLGVSWNKITVEEQKEFVPLFSELLSRTYLAKIREGVRDSEVIFGKEKLNDNLAIVETNVTMKGEKLAVVYRVYRKEDGKWLVYDVVIENVGIVSNYRDEFAGLMRKGGFAAVMERLRSKEISTKSAQS